jgi:hypothetical protein
MKSATSAMAPELRVLHRLADVLADIIVRDGQEGEFDHFDRMKAASKTLAKVAPGRLTAAKLRFKNETDPEADYETQPD